MRVKKKGGTSPKEGRGEGKKTVTCSASANCCDSLTSQGSVETKMTTAVVPSSPLPSLEDRHMYYILTDDFPYGSKLFQAGSMCFLKEKTYLHSIACVGTSTQYLRVTMLDDNSIVTVKAEILHPLPEEEAVFLLAINTLSERLNCFLDRHSLEEAVKATVGQQVTVDLNQQLFTGTIRYIGKISKNSSSSPHSPSYFGVELQGGGEGRGHCDGTYNGSEYFKCKQNHGLFLPVNKIKFIPVLDCDSMKEEPQPDVDEIVPVKVGDTVGFYLDEVFRQGVAMDVHKEGTQWFVKVCPEEEGTTDVFREIPMDSVVKEGLLSSEFEPDMAPGSLRQIKRERSESGEDLESGKHSLDVNSVVQITLDKGNSVTGIIRWLGYLPNIKHRMAGVELDQEKGITDGEWQGEIDGPQVLANSPLENGAAVQVLQGRMRGIQGHCNSCYMDAALFSLFSCTSVLDSMLFKPSLPPSGHVQKILRDEIVNPLRRNGFVAASSVMHLREQLTEKGQCSSFTTSEKDPEEFLNLIMHHILGIEPLLKLQSGGQKEQECYYYQIFIDKQEDLVVPNVQQLVEHSFLSSSLKLVEIPSCFIIQMPRFGKEYKMFSKIIPSLELDITDLLLDSPRECFVCGDIATQECSECFRDAVFADMGMKQYCNSCCRQVHSHYRRKTHRPTTLHVPEAFQVRSQMGSPRIPRERMELFAVLCIETSHYVSFVKYGPEKENWMFFDSMADRHGDENGYNIPIVKLCPEVAKYLQLPGAALAMEQPRDMEGVAKRLFCDAYMYMYQSKKMSLYK
nr:ubiquitin carboxyl-terminal hydrolase CYLD-like isoform X2 [Pelodiscus sinensis]|eukprot:XP_006131743.1 ubiquitin carboxyl-terminal hydrolase CYLD-like isoform X2 [Pelodiscus sinensis]